eukprot:CAMPEP_0179855308 /NCGR_PEP_ID=MMETSP0982-20121206/10447_1 /TAXON_ID=483367 /ORGANISM="non described non described, Strain CCMP 2436" /LENGTH=97 /DNA_ID=CAMNT_0021741351 /DNA_START=446 /DNA_END=736 /DNA_ORIENTATION=-
MREKPAVALGLNLEQPADRRRASGERSPPYRAGAPTTAARAARRLAMPAGPGARGTSQVRAFAPPPGRRPYPPRGGGFGRAGSGTPWSCQLGRQVKP